jgi:hypothetical protein
MYSSLRGRIYVYRAYFNYPHQWIDVCTFITHLQKKTSLPTYVGTQIYLITYLGKFVSLRFL